MVIIIIYNYFSQFWILQNQPSHECVFQEDQKKGTSTGVIFAMNNVYYLNIQMGVFVGLLIYSM